MSVSEPEETWEEFAQRKAAGWCVVYIGRERTPKQGIFANVSVGPDGPWPTQADARRAANRLRSKYRREDQRGHAQSEMVRVSARPLWKAEP